MLAHLRGNLWLLGLTFLVCCVLYPLVMLGLGQIVFHDKAEGSLLEHDGKPVGSKLIGQAFTSDEYFQPRPSATSPGPYNASFSGGSNLAASNILLRDRVARQLGSIVTYRNGDRVGPEVQTWFLEAPNRVAQWAKAYPTLAAAWISGDKLNSAFVTQWASDHAQDLAFVDWRKENSENTAPKPEELAQPFFQSFAAARPHYWFTQEDAKNDRGEPIKDDKGNPTKRTVPVEVKVPRLVDGDYVDENTDVQAYFFDLWLQAHKDVVLEPVPADMVMASGSGLDPHITVDNANWQLSHRIAGAWAARLIKESDPTIARTEDPDQVKKLKTEARKQLESKIGKRLEDKITELIQELLNKHQEAPLAGLVGPDIVNVLELNLDVEERMNKLAKEYK